MGFISKVRKMIDLLGGWKINGTEVTSTAAELNILDGVTRTAAQINAGVRGLSAGYVIERGNVDTVAASDDINTTLTTVVAVLVALSDDPVDGCQFVTADIGDQAGAPAAGHFYLKSWMITSDADTTLKAATTFGKAVNWVAIGTKV